MMRLRSFGLLALLALAALLQGCATTAVATSAGATADPRDPWESMNRKVYAFNDAVDQALVKPVARTYVEVVPPALRTGVRHFIGNLTDVWSFVNAGLQLKGQQAVEGFMRVVINSTIGLYGVLDVATEAGLRRYKEDFGQTLGHWGVKPGPFVVLPFLGPSTVRDALALPADTQFSPSGFFDDNATRLMLTALNITETRASLLRTTDALIEASLDPYSFMRDAWLQKRQNDVYDGDPPSDFDYRDPDAPPEPLRP